MAISAKDMASRRVGGVAELIVSSIRHNTKQYTMFIALIAIWVILAFLTDGIFLTSRNLSNLFVQTVTTAILAIGMVLVIVAGHIDLSVGSVMGFAGAICAMAMIKLEWGPLASVLATLGVGAAIGAWHGFWVAYRKVPAFIVSLASMLAFRGLIIGITGGQTQGLEMAPTATADRFKLIGQGYVPTFRQAAEGSSTTRACTSHRDHPAVVCGACASARRAGAYGFPVLPGYLRRFGSPSCSAIIFAFPHHGDLSRIP
jgi:D-xylose transport system permease protein